MPRDYYEILGVSPQATDDQIKKAYRKLAREHHPDRVQGPEKAGAEARFKEIAAAYDTLSDGEKRKSYDQMRQFGAGFGQGGFHQGPIHRGFGQDSYGPFRPRPSSAPGAGFEDIFASMFGNLRFEEEAPSETSVDISLEDAARGATREVTNLATGRRFRVKIPPGIEHLGKVRAGQTVVTVRIQPHPLFRREGGDLHLELPVTFWEAIEGAELEIPTLDGAIKMKIPPRTPAGKVFRIKGKGMPLLKGDAHGDLFVKVVIHLPTEIDDQALALWRRLSTMHSYHPRAHLRRGG